MAHGVDQLSQATRDIARGPGYQTGVLGNSCLVPKDPGWTSGPGVLGLRPEGLWVPQHFSGDSGRSRGTAVSSNSPGRLGPVSDIPQGRPAVLGDLGPGRRDRGVEQGSRATRASVRRPAGSTRYSGGPGPCPRPRGVNQMSLASPAQLRGPGGSTSYPGSLALGSEGRQGRSAVLGVSRIGLRAHGAY